MYPRETAKHLQPAFAEVGFGGYETSPTPPSGHTHDDIEISAFEHGSVTMLYGGRPVAIPPDQLIVHWGMLPHQVVGRDPDALVVGLHIPLVWVLQWRLPPAFMAKLLNLELMIEPRRDAPCSDLARLRDWCRILENQPVEGTEIVLTEVRGRLLRLAASQSETEAMDPPRSDGGRSQVFDQALALITSHFREPLRIADVAEATGVSARHVTRLFHQHTGQTINGYLTRLRISHAQRLLVTSERKIVDIMNEAGFSCSTHFYRTFGEYAGCTPREYRQKYPRNQQVAVTRVGGA